MAIGIHRQKTARLLGTPIKHEAHHDLESFYWLLVWMVLRHARYVHSWGSHAERTLFGCADHTFYASVKAVWLDVPAVVVWDNVPLTRLLRRFTDAVRANNPPLSSSKGSGVLTHLNHTMVLEMLGEALDSDGWPENDAAFTPNDREAWREYSPALYQGAKCASEEAAEGPCINCDCPCRRWS